MKVSISQLGLEEAACELIQEIANHLNVNFDSIPNVVRDDVILQTLINLRTVFLQHPHYENSNELRYEVKTIDRFISELN